MLAADQKAQHEKLDRLVNAGNADDVVAFARDTLDHHFRALRALQLNVKWLARQASRCNRSIVPNYGVPGRPWNQYDDMPDMDPELEARACREQRGFKGSSASPSGFARGSAGGHHRRWC